MFRLTLFALVEKWILPKCLSGDALSPKYTGMSLKQNTTQQLKGVNY
jgi:hypothetical protein